MNGLDGWAPNVGPIVGLIVPREAHASIGKLGRAGKYIGLKVCGSAHYA